MNWGNFYQMSGMFYEEIYGHRKLIEDALRMLSLSEAS